MITNAYLMGWSRGYMRKHAAELGEPQAADKPAIIDFMLEAPDLDDAKAHAMFEGRGVDPHEGEEFVYAALRAALEAKPELRPVAEAAGEIESEKTEEKEEEQK